MFLWPSPLEILKGKRLKNAAFARSFEKFKEKRSGKQTIHRHFPSVA